MRLNKGVVVLLGILTVLIPTLSFSDETKSVLDKSIVVLSGSKRLQAITAKDERTKKIILQDELEKMGKKLLKEKKYNEAIARFEAAVEIDKELYGNEMGGGYAGIARTYEEQGNYELALDHVLYLVKDKPKQESFFDWKKKLEAFIRAKKDGTNKPIYDYISFYLKKYKKDLPPKKYWVQSVFYTSKIIQLYDHIGDVDGGIAFVDGILAYKKLTPSARENYRKVRQAFIDDKANGVKGGATNVIIQSDYFPW